MNTNMKELNAQELAMANGGACLAGGLFGDPTFPPVGTVLAPFLPIVPVPIKPPFPPINPIQPNPPFNPEPINF